MPAARLRRGGEVADRAADADHAPPVRAGAREPRPPASSTFFSTCARSALTCLGDVVLPSRKRSVMRTAPIRHDRASVAMRPSTRESCIEPPPMSSATPSASVVELTAAR